MASGKKRSSSGLSKVPVSSSRRRRAKKARASNAESMTEIYKSVEEEESELKKRDPNIMTVPMTW